MSNLTLPQQVTIGNVVLRLEDMLSIEKARKITVVRDGKLRYFLVWADKAQEHFDELCDRCRKHHERNK